MERNCWFCHKPLPLTKLFRRELFCSSEHEDRYFSEQSALALERMKEPQAPAKPVPIPVEAMEPVAAEEPVENVPPMAALMREQVFACEARRIAIGPEDAMIAIAEPAQPPSLGWLTPELESAGRISENLAWASAASGGEDAFPSVPVAEAHREIAQPLPPARPAVADPLKLAQWIPEWNGRAVSLADTNVVLADASAPLPVAARTPVVEAGLQSNLDSTAPTCSWALRTAMDAPSTGLVFVSSAAIQRRDVRAEAGARKPNPPQLGARGRLPKTLTVTRRDADVRPAILPIHIEPSRQASTSGTAGPDLPLLRACVSAGNSWGNARAAGFEPVPVPSIDPTSGESLAVSIRPPGTVGIRCGLTPADFRESPRRAIDRRGVDSTVSCGARKSTGTVIVPPARHEITSKLPSAPADTGWANPRATRAEPLSRLAPFSIDRRHAVTIPPARTELGACRPTAPEYCAILAGAMTTHEPISMAAYASLKPARTVTMPRARHDIQRSLRFAPTNGSWDSTRPVASDRAPRLASVGTTKHTGAIATQAKALPRITLRPTSANSRSTQQAVLDWLSVDRPSLRAQHTPTRAASFDAIRVDNVLSAAGVKAAVPRDLGRSGSDSPVPRFVYTRQSEPVPASLMAEPGAPRSQAAALEACVRIDGAHTPVEDETRVLARPSLDRHSQVPRRIPKTRSAKLTVSAMRATTAAAGLSTSRNDAGTEPRIAPPPPIRVQPASMLAAPIALPSWQSDYAGFVASRRSGTAPLFAIDWRVQAMPYGRGEKVRL